jgi:hypothetical protein
VNQVAFSDVSTYEPAMPTPVEKNALSVCAFRQFGTNADRVLDAMQHRPEGLPACEEQARAYRTMRAALVRQLGGNWDRSPAGMAFRILARRFAGVGVSI